MYNWITVLYTWNWHNIVNPFGSVQSLSRVQLSETSWTTARQASLSTTNSRSLLKLLSMELVMPSNYVILCRPLLLLPSIFPRIRVFSSVSVLHIRWPKYWSFNFSISPSNEYSGLISFRIDWFDPYCPRDSQESSPTPQFKSINSSVLSFLYGPTLTSIHANSKSISLTIWTLVGKVMSLLFNMLSSLVIAFLPKSKHLFISWLQSPSAVILEPQKIKSVTVSTVSPSTGEPDAMILIFWMLSFKPAFSLSSFTFIKRFFSSSLLSVIRVVSSAHLRLLIFLLAILISARALSSLVFHMMYSAYKLNKQGDNIQPWCTPFPIWNQPIGPCPVLTVDDFRFLLIQISQDKGKVVWYSDLLKNFPQFVVIHIVKGFSLVNETEVDQLKSPKLNQLN